jgi:hypothetical protein
MAAMKEWDRQMPKWIKDHHKSWETLKRVSIEQEDAEDLLERKLRDLQLQLQQLKDKHTSTAKLEAELRGAQEEKKKARLEKTESLSVLHDSELSFSAFFNDSKDFQVKEEKDEADVRTKVMRGGSRCEES